MSDEITQIPPVVLSMKKSAKSAEVDIRSIPGLKEILEPEASLAFKQKEPREVKSPYACYLYFKKRPGSATMFLEAQIVLDPHVTLRKHVIMSSEFEFGDIIELATEPKTFGALIGQTCKVTLKELDKAVLVFVESPLFGTIETRLTFEELLSAKGRGENS